MLRHAFARLTSVALVIVLVQARPFPCSTPPLPHPTNDLTPQPGRDLQQTCCYPEMRSPLPPPYGDLPSPSLQPPFFFPETKPAPPPPYGDLPSLQPPFFFPEPPPQFLQPPFFFSEPSPQFLQPPFFHPGTSSPSPPYLEKGHSLPTGESKFIHKLMIATGILAVILVLLALSTWLGLDLEKITQVLGLSAAVATCLGA